MSSATTAPTALDPELAARLDRLEAGLASLMDDRFREIQLEARFLRGVLYEMSAVVKPLRTAIAKVLKQ